MPIPVLALAGAPTAEEKTKLRAWRKDDHLVANWFLNVMEPYIADIMSLQNTAVEIWEKAESLYSKKRNYVHIYQLNLELQQIKQQGHSIAEINSHMQKK
jgi:hypothetical protein